MKGCMFMVYTMVFILCGELKAQKQNDDIDYPKRFKTIGGLVGFGNSFSKNTDYQVFYMMADYSKSFTNPKKKDFVAWYAEPQFNLVKAGSTKSGSFDYEYGLNLGIRNYIKINEGFYLYQMLGSGPHYISAEVVRQASGFIFSDNFAVGTFLRLNKKLFLNVQYVQRHISNANLKAPNGGINFYNVVIGVSQLK
jgi:hypothetical protein